MPQDYVEYRPTGFQTPASVALEQATDYERTDQGFLAPAAYAEYGIDPRSNRRARQLAAEITREQFDLERDLYGDLEENLLSTLYNPSYRREQAMDAYGAAQDASGRDEAATNRRLASYGLEPTDRQQASMDRGRAFSESRSRISAYNNASRAARDREQQLFGGGLGTLPEVPGA